MVDILSAVLSGANYGPWAPPFVTFLNPSDQPVGKGIGHFLGAMRVDAFRPAEEFKNHMDNWIRAFRNARTIEGQERVIIPGDPEREMEAVRRKDGIPLLMPVVRDLKEVGLKAGIDFAEQ
jgi:LDH2 family malate/lactate/ureidoglycolate dehydrogenase